MGGVINGSLDAVGEDLIGCLYAASTDPLRWPDFINQVSRRFGGHSGLFLRPGDDPARTRILAGDQDPERIREHNEYYAGIIPQTRYRSRTHSVLDLIEDRLEIADYLRTEYYNDWMRPQGLMYWAGVRPSFGDDGHLGLSVARSAQRGAFSAQERQVLIALSNHLQRAGEISRRLELFETQSRAVSGVLADLNAGVLLVDAEMKVVFANPVAEELLIAADGVSARAGRLRAATPRLDGALRDAVRRATGAFDASGPPGVTLSLPRGTGDPPLTLTVSPLDERDRPSLALGPLALMVIGMPERDIAVDPERLRAAFDLTPAEARLAVALCAGRSLAEHAADAGVSLNTLKFHLKAVFDKTGETRQPELVRRLVANAALRRAIDGAGSADGRVGRERKAR